MSLLTRGASPGGDGQQSVPSVPFPGGERSSLAYLLRQGVRASAPAAASPRRGDNGTHPNEALRRGSGDSEHTVGSPPPAPRPRHETASSERAPRAIQATTETSMSTHRTRGSHCGSGGGAGPKSPGVVRGRGRSPATERLRDLLPLRAGLVGRSVPGVRGTGAGPAVVVGPVQPPLMEASGGLAFGSHRGYEEKNPQRGLSCACLRSFRRPNSCGGSTAPSRGRSSGPTRTVRDALRFAAGGLSLPPS